jgi:hypothetical protein
MAPPQSAGPSDPLTQMNKYRSYVTILADSSAKDEIKVKAAQELSENFEASTEKILGISQQRMLTSNCVVHNAM